jgi:hypothetical protein
VSQRSTRPCQNARKTATNLRNPDKATAVPGKLTPMAQIRTIDEYDFGFSWVIDEAMTRTSHALVDDGRVWLIDPVDVPEQVERAAGLGEPAAVVRLLDRHGRDCDAVAARLGVPLLDLPQQMPDSPFEAVALTHNRLWKEVALWWPQRQALVVAEAVGTNAMFTAGATPLGVHVGLRLFPPKRLAGFTPEHILVGHGAGLHGPATAAALTEALARSRKDLPKVLVKLPTALR